MRVKICGLMRLADVRAALDSGADALGFVVSSPSSPRNLSLNAAHALMKNVPVFATKVAVTSADDSRSVTKICSKLEPDALQLHRYRRQIVGFIRRKHPETKLILARAISDRISLGLASWTARESDAVLADSPSLSGMGGTGRTHDWSLTAALRDRIYPHPLILAGGLTPNNVQQAIRKVRPFAVDVSTGVEKTIGVKDPKKIRDFIKKAKENPY
jgi:phosphoribosylanthranilate isomerase